VYAGRILRQVVEDERLQPEEFLVGRIPVEVDLEARLVRVARAASPGADADVEDGLAVPLEVGRVESIGLEVLLQLCPFGAMQLQVDALERRFAK
jgi:hypothetical protein